MKDKAQKIVFTSYVRGFTPRRERFYRAVVAWLMPRRTRTLKAKHKAAEPAVKYGMKAVKRYNRLVDKFNQA